MEEGRDGAPGAGGAAGVVSDPIQYYANGAAFLRAHQSSLSDCEEEGEGEPVDGWFRLPGDVDAPGTSVAGRGGTGAGSKPGKPPGSGLGRGKGMGRGGGLGGGGGSGALVGSGGAGSLSNHTLRQASYDTLCEAVDSCVGRVVSDIHDEVFKTTSEFFLASMAARREDPVAAFGGRPMTAVQPFGAERLDSIPTAVVFAGGLRMCITRTPAVCARCACACACGWHCGACCGTVTACLRRARCTQV